MGMFEKDVYTTGEVAKICNVAARTVSKWFDSGQIDGYRIPGSKDRRIPSVSLNKFMKSHGIPFDGNISGKTRVLIFDEDAQSRKALAEALRVNTEFDVHESENSFEAGIDCERLRPHVLMYASNNSKSPFKNLRKSNDLADTKFVEIFANSDVCDENFIESEKYCDKTISKPFTVREAIEAIEEATAVVY